MNIADAVRMHGTGASDDEILSELRERGCSKLQCVVVMRELGFSLIEAKTLVHESRVWADARWRDDHILDGLEQE
jgi:hypothetical protein